MIKLYNKDGTTLIGDLSEYILDIKVEEERNGLFELTMIYPSNYKYYKELKTENIIVADANNVLTEQKFRIYNTRKLYNNRIEVVASHITYDLLSDFIEKIEIENQSCEYCLKQLFLNSNFSKHYKGISDIINAQNFKVDRKNLLGSIVGSQGSIIDTFGTGAEIIRNNETISILNRRGHDNGVVIEYGNNLTGFTCNEDTSELITRIYPYVKKNVDGVDTIITLNNKYVDSDRINNYSHPYIKSIDFTEKFGQDEAVTQEKLLSITKKYFIDNKCDIPKMNFKINFVLIEKHGLNLCDVVTVKHRIYDVDTQAKVIKTTYNPLLNRYISMELGEPKATLGDLIGGDGSVETDTETQKPVIDDTDFPNTLPTTPVLEGTVKGFASVDLSWTFENKTYYTYQLYASKVKDFSPNAFDLIFEGQSSNFLHQVKPSEVWYYRCRAINTHGNATQFSTQLKIETKKLDSFEEYFSSLAVGELVAAMFSVDYMEAGIIKGAWIDAKNLSVTDGNGKRTLDVDSFGNINLDVATLKIKSKNVETILNTNAEQIKEIEQKVTSEAIIDTVSSTIDNKISDIKVGGANLLKDAYLNKHSTAYNVATLYFGKRKPKTGDKVTVQIKGYLSEDRVAYGVYNSGGMQLIANLDRDTVKNGIYTGIATWQEYGENNRIEIYGLNAEGGTCYIEWVKLEFGTTATDYTDYVDVTDLATSTELTEVKQTSKDFQIKVEGTSTFNMLQNSRPKGNVAEWDYTKDGNSQCFLSAAEWQENAENWNGEYFRSGVWFTGILGDYDGWCHLVQKSLSKQSFDMNKKYTLIFPYHTDNDCTISVTIADMDSYYHVYGSGEIFSQNGYKWFKATFTPQNKGNQPVIHISYRSAGYQIRMYIPWMNLYEGEMSIQRHIESTRGSYSAIATFNDDGLRTDFEDGTYMESGRHGLKYYKNGMARAYQYITFITKTDQLRNGYWTWVNLPDFFRGKYIDTDFKVTVSIEDIDCNAYVNSGLYKGALRNFKAEVGYWESENCRLQVRACIQKIGLDTGKVYGWDDASTDAGAVAGESSARVVIQAQM